ncbi:hypothetical protein FQN49_008523, partial [Arthroderma sp. PD_2]
KAADCGSSEGYSFSGIDYTAKGERLQSLVKDSVGKDVKNDHDFNNVKQRYTIQVDDKSFPPYGREMKDIYKEVGLDTGTNLLYPPLKWRKYQVFGIRKKDKAEDGTDETKDVTRGRDSAVEAYFSIEDKAIVRQRFYKREKENTKPGDEIYDKELPASERLEMSEWTFQLRKDTVNEARERNIDINIGDLEKVLVQDIENKDTQDIIFKAQKDVGGGKNHFTVTPDHPEAFNGLSASSAGVSNFRMLADHNSPSEFNGLVPTKALVFVDDRSHPMVAWIFTRSH